VAIPPKNRRHMSRDLTFQGKKETDSTSERRVGPKRICVPNRGCGRPTSPVRRSRARTPQPRSRVSEEPFPLGGYDNNGLILDGPPSNAVERDRPVRQRKVGTHQRWENESLSY